MIWSMNVVFILRWVFPPGNRIGVVEVGVERGSRSKDLIIIFVVTPLASSDDIDKGINHWGRWYEWPNRGLHSRVPLWLGNPNRHLGCLCCLPLAAVLAVLLVSHSQLLLLLAKALKTLSATKEWTPLFVTLCAPSNLPILSFSNDQKCWKSLYPWKDECRVSKLKQKFSFCCHKSQVTRLYIHSAPLCSFLSP